MDRQLVLIRETGRIWFGDSAIDIVEQRRAEGLTSPLFFERVGYTAYFRKGRGGNSRNYDLLADEAADATRWPTDSEVKDL